MSVKNDKVVLKMMNTTSKDMFWDEKINRKERLIATPGIWINGKTYWLHNEREKSILEEGISIHVKQRTPHSKISYLDIYISNHERKEKQLKLLMMHQHENQLKEHFSFVSPVEKVIYHLAGQNVYLVNGSFNGEQISQCTIQSQWNFYKNTYWDCLEKGILKYQPMVKGIAVSLYSFKIDLQGRETVKSSSWIISGKNKSEILDLNACFLKTH